MHTDWMLVATIASPILAVIITLTLERLIEQRPNLIAYFTHASAFTLPPTAPGQNIVTVHTHGIVIRNVGKRPAIEVRVRHLVLPTARVIFPDMQHRIENLPGGGAEIVFPILVPDEQVWISYLYSPPIFFNQMHAGIRHNEGFATEVTTIPSPHYPPWVQKMVWFLLILGTMALIYIGIEAITYGYRIMNLLK
jgi:hypothetical protein